jgi:hypothetical protein
MRPSSPVAPTRQQPSSPAARFQRSVTPTSVTSPTSAGPHVKGTYAFLPNGKNDDRSGYIRAHSRPIHDLYYDLPGIGSSRSRTPDLSKSTQRGSRTDFQKQIHMGTGLYYDLPGMAEKPTTRSPNLAKSVFAGDRTAYLRAINFPKSEYIPLPGMADEIQRDRRGSLAFRLVTSSSRDSHVRASHKTTGLVYDVPGIAETLARDAMKGTAAFRMSSPNRGSPIRSSRKSSADADAFSCRTSSPDRRRGSALPGGAVDASVVGARFSVDAYVLPGMADEVLKSPKGSLAFRTTSPRGDYIRQFQKTNDLCYDIPGMSGVVYSKAPTSPRPQSSSRQQQQVLSPSCGVHRGHGRGVEAGRRFDSPTKASTARQEAVARELHERAQQ